MMNIRFLTCGLLLSYSSLNFADNLLQHYQSAQQYDAAYASAQAQYQADQEKGPQGKALLQPNINLNASYNQVDNHTSYSGPSTLPSGSSSYHTQGYSLNLSQPLFRPQNWQTYQSSKLQLELARVQQQQAEQALVLRVAQAYFDTLIAQDQLELTLAQKQAIAEQLAQAKRNFELGTSNITDTHEAQARFDLISAQEISARNTLSLKQQALQQISGKNDTLLKRLKQPPKIIQLQPEKLEDWQQRAQQQNLQVIAAQISINLAERNLNREKAGHYPTLDLVASYSNNDSSGGITGLGSDTRNRNIGLQFNLPIYQGGATSSKHREAQSLLQRSQHELENTRRSINQQTQQAYQGVVNGAAQILALQQAQTSSEKLLDASKLGQQVGVRTNLDVLNAQQQLYATRKDYYQAQYLYLLSQLQLEAATGQLNQQAVTQVNSMLE